MGVRDHDPEADHSPSPECETEIRRLAPMVAESASVVRRSGSSEGTASGRTGIAFASVAVAGTGYSIPAASPSSAVVEVLIATEQPPSLPESAQERGTVEIREVASTLQACDSCSRSLFSTGDQV